MLPPVHKEVVELLMQVKKEFGLKLLFQMIVKWSSQTNTK